MGFCKRRILVIDNKPNVLTRLSTVPFQKLISDDRFRSENEEDPESQLPVQFLATVASTPTLADEVQVEVMKVSQRFLIQVNSPRIFLFFSYLKLSELWDGYSPKFTMCKSFAVADWPLNATPYAEYVKLLTDTCSPYLYHKWFPQQYVSGVSE